MTPLREQYFAALLASQRADRLGSTRQKVLVSKSATDDAPPIVALRDGSGRIIGFGAAERIDLAEVARVNSLGKQTVSKSAVQTVLATSGDDPNSIFDGLFSFCDEPDDERSEVAKSAYRPTAEDTLAEGFFPPCLRSK